MVFDLIFAETFCRYKGCTKKIKPNIILFPLESQEMLDAWKTALDKFFFIFCDDHFDKMFDQLDEKGTYQEKMIDIIDKEWN